jgi:hypothetical protein
MNLPNGLWHGQAGDDNQGLRLDIRVDLNRPPRFDKISADLYTLEAGTDRFDATFESTSFEPSAGNTIFVVRLVVIGTQRQATFIFSQAAGQSFPSLIFQQDGQEAVFVDLTYGGSEILRTISAQVEIQAGVDEDLQQFDQAYPPAEIDWKNRTISVDKCFTDAGFSLALLRRNQPLAGPAAWDSASLRQALSTNFDPSLRGDPTAMYLLIATAYSNGNGQADPNVFGIMFDELHRRGAAVFYRSLKNRYDDLFARNYIRTVVHEVGHALNLPHAFEHGNLAGRDDADGAAKATFMNYPHLYTGGGIGDAAEQESFYWRDFTFSFAPGELLFLGHGPLDQVRPGTAYIRQVISSQGVSDAVLEIPGGSGGARQEIDQLRLSLRLRPERSGNLFCFGEPVHVEAELANGSGGRRRVLRALQPSAATTRYLIRKPHGEIITFRPPFTCCRGRDEQELRPGQSLHTDVSLSFSNGDFPFVEPGRYQVQAVYQGLGPPLHSNILQLWVRYPTADEENVVVPTFDDSVSAYLSVGGHPDLTGAVTRLERFLADPSNTRDGKLLPTAHPLAFYYCRCRALRSLTEQHSLKGNGGRPALETIPPKPDDYTLFRESLGLDANFNLRPDTVKLPLSNLIVGTLGRRLGEALKQEERTRDMRTALRSVRTYLRQSNDNKAEATVRAFDRHRKQPPPHPMDRDWV